MKFNQKLMRRKAKCETCLNGETRTAVRCTNNDSGDNPVPNRVNRNSIQPRKQPGLYIVRCNVNDWRYYGESTNVSGRLASHKSLLNRGIHANKPLQADFNTYGEQNFDFIVLYMGSDWDDKQTRLARETQLIIQDRSKTYNVFAEQNRSGERNAFYGRFQTQEAKQKIGEAMRGIPNDKLGKDIVIDNIEYPSLAEAARQLKLARKTIRERLNNPAFENYQYKNNAE